MDSGDKTENMNSPKVVESDNVAGGNDTVWQRLSDDDALSEAGKSSCSSHHFGSPNPSESDEHSYMDADGKKKRRRIVTDPSTPRSSFPMSERQQLALLKQITAPDSSFDSPKSPGQLTPTTSGRSRGKISRVHRRNNLGETPLHVAAKKGEYRQCRILLDEGADVNCVDNAGWTPLHEACNHNWEKTAKVLIEHGANVNATGMDNDTPLHDAAANGNKILTILLLKHGAGEETMNKEGKRPVDLCEDMSLKKILVGHNYDVEREKSPVPSPASIDSEPMECEHMINSEINTSPPLKLSPANNDLFEFKDDGTSPVDHSSLELEVEDRTKENLDLDENGSKIVCPDFKEIEKDITNKQSRDDEMTTDTSGEDNVMTEACDDQDSASDLVAGLEMSENVSPETDTKDETIIDDTDQQISDSKVEDTHERPVTPINLASDPNESTSNDGVRTAPSRLTQSPRSRPAVVRSLRKREMIRQQKRRKHWQQQVAAKKRRVETQPKKHGHLMDTPTSSKTLTTDVYDFHASDSDDGNNVLPNTPVSVPIPVTAKKRTTGGGQRGRPRKTPVTAVALFASSKTADQLEVDLARNTHDTQYPSTHVASSYKKRRVPETSQKQRITEDQMNEDSENNSAHMLAQLSLNVPDQTNVAESNEGDIGDDKSSESASRKVPPLRIVFSRSASDEEANSEHSGKAPVFNKTTEEGSTNSAPISESKRAKTINNGNGTSETTQRLTRSQVRAKGLELDTGVGASGKPETDGAGSSTMSFHPHKKKMAKANRTIVPVTASQHICHWSQTTTTENTETILMKNSYEAYRDLRNIIENKWFNDESETNSADQPYIPPRNYQNFMLSKKSYLLQKSLKKEKPSDEIPVPLQTLPESLQKMYVRHEEERSELATRHRVERERLILSCEKEVLRVHARYANKSQLPLSAVRVFRDAEIYNSLELDKPSLLSPNSSTPSLSTIDDLATHVEDAVSKFSKRKIELISRHRLEAQSLQAVQQMSWESQLKKAGLLPMTENWKLDTVYVPSAQVVQVFNLLPIE